LAGNVSYLWKSPDAARNFTTGISLHSHTSQSKEGLSFIPERAELYPMFRWFLHQQRKKCKKVRLDFSRAYWTPPLTPRAAYELERNQIVDKLGLASIVSITDHDSIEAPLMLRLLPETRHIPISLEWSVPFGSTEVHLGVHNLPSSSCPRWLSEMHRYTEEMKEKHLAEILAGLNEIQDLLIVLNHPMWDLCAVGQTAHRNSLENFLAGHNQFVHAFELGGLRSWDENQRVVDLADAWKQTLISGGDRHGCEPNAVLNLTSAKSFPEFVQEIRRDHQSNVVFMPQYQQSLAMRMIHTINDVSRYMPDHPLGPNWDDRTFHPDPTGELRPLSQIWEHSPGFIKTTFAALQLLEAKPVTSAVRYVWGGSKNAFRFPGLRQGGETA
jgi:hypothetical protein